MPPFSLISRISYAALLSPLQPRQSASAQLQSAFLRNNSDFDRMMSLANLVDRAVPGTAKRLSRWIYKNNRFPWKLVDTELIAYGSGAAVFRINWNHGHKVLRIYRRSLGKSFRGLIETAEYYKRNYDTVLSLYGSATGLVLPMEFLVLQGMPLVGPVAASLQPYIDGQKQDPFEDFSDPELLSLLEANDYVREQFLHFARQTIHQWDEQKMCYDFVGRENLMLVNQGGDYRLRIVDVGIFKFDVPAHSSTEKIAQIKQRIDRLISLYEAAKAI